MDLDLACYLNAKKILYIGPLLKKVVRRERKKLHIPFVCDRHIPPTEKSKTL